jgi:hypothetical protein
MRYYVPIVARRQLNYIVEARDENGARQAAIDRFNAGNAPEECGNEWEEIERIGAIEPVGEQHT